jgi:hypothetical protein
VKKKKKKKYRIKFDEGIAKSVFQILDHGWKYRTGIFKNTILPQDRYPSQTEWETFFANDRERFNWLLCVVLSQRGGILSEVPFKLFWWLRQEFPEMFDPKIVAEKWSPESIEEKLQLGIATIYAAKREQIKNNKVVENQQMAKSAQQDFPWMFRAKPLSEKQVFSDTKISINNEKEIRGYKTKEIPKYWYSNFLVLHKYWGDDLANVFWGVTEFEQAFSRVDYKINSETGFQGIRRKLFSLLVIWLQGKNLLPIFPVPIPIDIHAQRILWSTEILAKVDWARPFKPKKEVQVQLAGKTAIRVYEAFTDEIAKWSQKFIVENGFSHLNVNPALWVLGRSLCAEHWQNTSREKATIYVEPKELAKNPHLWRKNYKDPCSYCPIEKYCQWAIPDAPHSNWGLLVRLGKRVPYPSVRLPFLDWQEIVPYIPRKNHRL